VRYGIDAGGELAKFLLGQREREHITGYLGCVPSIVRAGLQRLPDVSGATFVDLGCGKGRALIVASEFPFARVVGIELDKHLAGIASRNASIVSSRRPGRPPIEVVCGDASSFAVPDGDVVAFLYHPFDGTLVRRLVDHLVAASWADRQLFVVYANPVHGALFDERTEVHRWYAETLPCTEEEAALGGAPTETVMIWRLGPPEPASSHPTSGCLVVNAWGDRADIIESPGPAAASPSA
jgi:SAM-dependent methyltransferase